MRLFAAFFALFTISTPALACLTPIEPGLDGMVKDSTLIVRGQVLRETGNIRENARG
jgi:hypothetical protein